MYADFFATKNYEGPLLCMADAPKHEAMKKPCMQAWMKFLSQMEEFVCQGKKFLVCETLTPADFVIGGWYVNLAANPNRPHYKPEFAMLLKKFPNFAAYGERFRAENKTYLDSRPAKPA